MKVKFNDKAIDSIANVKIPRFVKQLIGLIITFIIAIIAGVAWDSALTTLLIGLLPVLGIDQATTVQGQNEFADLLNKLDKDA